LPPHSRRRLMRALVAVQVAFCFLVHLAAGLFVTTFDRLAHQSIGISPERLLTLDTVAKRPQPAVFWDQVASHLRDVPGVERVALSGWPLLAGNGWNGFIWVNNAPTEVLAYFLGVSPGFVETMGIGFAAGRDLRAGETYPGVALVNEAFVKQCFAGENPIGRWFEKESGDGVTRHRFQVVGVVRDARYRNLREPVTPTAYVPFPGVAASGAGQPKASGTFIVRTASANPLALASVLRLEIPRARPEFRVSNIRTQQELIDQHTVRERLLAMLGVFFAGVALLLAAVGLYGVLDYSVVARCRELGIRIAIGAPPRDIARGVTREIFTMVIAGAIAGLAVGIVASRYIANLLFGVKPTDPGMLLVPALIILPAALLAAVPAIVRALRIDPLAALR
jgi:predicted permease